MAALSPVAINWAVDRSAAYAALAAKNVAAKGLCKEVRSSALAYAGVSPLARYLLATGIADDAEHGTGYREGVSNLRPAPLLETLKLRRPYPLRQQHLIILLAAKTQTSPSN